MRLVTMERRAKPDEFADEISYIQDLIDRIGAEKMEALHRTAWDIIAESLSQEELEKMTQIIKEMRDSGRIVNFKPEIKLMVFDSPPDVVH